jgi:uncharacterized protein (TIGR00375 family)
LKIIADFHLHSKYSRATAKNLDLENLYISAQKKGITVLGTGDFTHPGWFSEIKEKLITAEPGLFKLNDGLSQKCDQQVPLSCRGSVRFVLVSEISNIYKKNKKTRKNHNLVFFPDIDSAEKFNSTLDKIGNIKSDGRPILGLDAKNLLEIVLETSNQGFLIPAHIWTPWFSILGSKSGFDTIKECFEDLTPYIFALETGLSSDPAMNWRVSSLDGFTLVSNSDAHSPQKLGREANILETDLSYSAIKSAIESRDPKRFLGTIEFYPQEGKYHLDGHRKCNVRFWPEKTIETNGICPVCQKPLTLGVLYRVEQLADRPDNMIPSKRKPFYNIIPLAEILSEVLMVGTGSKRVQQCMNTLIERFGPEFNILHDMDYRLLDKIEIPLLSEAIKRMRQGHIELTPGFDGEFGKIKIFDHSEREYLSRQKSLFSIGVAKPMKTLKEKIGAKPSINHAKMSFSRETKNLKHQKKSKEQRQIPLSSDITISNALAELNHQQRTAVEHPSGPILIVAGPGTGKTRTLTYRIAYLISQRNVSPQSILALTFTNQAAQVMRQRLKILLNDSKSVPLAITIHALCHNILQDQGHKIRWIIIDEKEQLYLVTKVVDVLERQGFHVPTSPKVLTDKIISAKQQMLSPQDNLESVINESESEILAAIYQTYQKLLSNQSYCDYEDLIFRVVKLFESDEMVRKQYQNRFQYILVDEYQDLNYGQYRLIRALSPPGKDLFVIGDPDQSIYGFRGSDLRYFNQFRKDYPDAKIVRLMQNYRSTQTILDASFQMISADDCNNRVAARIYSHIQGVKTLEIIEAASEKAEAVRVGQIIEKMVGGIGFYSVDFEKTDNSDEKNIRSFSDFAILYRTRNQGEYIATVLQGAGIPFNKACREELFYNQSLNELVSILKVIEEIGSYLDLERVIKYTKSGIGKKSLDTFIGWGLYNGFPLKEALIKVRRFPVRGIKREVQNKYDDFSEKLSLMRKKIETLRFNKKLEYILENKLLPVKRLQKDDLKTEYKNIPDLATQGVASTHDWLSKVALQSDTDIYDPQAEAVTLMTMHAAKGLEFPVIFITGCEQDLIPLTIFDNKSQDIEEEKRLFYVAMTRAKEQLFLTCAKRRTIFGKVVKRSLSPFVENIEMNLRQHESPNTGNIKAHTPVQLKLF